MKDGRMNLLFGIERRGAEKEESSGKVKLEAVADMERGGAGANSEAREGGRGKKKDSRGRAGESVQKRCSRAWSRAICQQESRRTY